MSNVVHMYLSLHSFDFHIVYMIHCSMGYLSAKV